jgi:hypothetical protein
MEKDNYVHVGQIIEDDKVNRIKHISKSINFDSTDNTIKKANEFNCEGELSPEIKEFEKAIENTSKSDKEIYLVKAQRELLKNPNNLKLKQIKAILINHLS